MIIVNMASSLTFACIASVICVATVAVSIGIPNIVIFFELKDTTVTYFENKS